MAGLGLGHSRFWRFQQAGREWPACVGHDTGQPVTGPATCGLAEYNFNSNHRSGSARIADGSGIPRVPTEPGDLTAIVYPTAYRPAAGGRRRMADPAGQAVASPEASNHRDQSILDFNAFPPEPEQARRRRPVPLQPAWPRHGVNRSAVPRIRRTLRPHMRPGPAAPRPVRDPC